MLQNNKHISEYLDYYFALNPAPGYAILLRGKWGSGKSWFMKDYIEKHNKKEYLYISLNGITSNKEIEDKFFEQIHPILASKGMKIAGKIIKGLLKTTVKIDIDGNNKEVVNLNSEMPEINLPDYLKNIDDKKIIFDDLERCSISIQNILGYINQFVENNEFKVIIIGNEEEIIKLDKDKEKEIKKSYLDIKEKIIGRSFDVQTDFNLAIKSFIQEIKDVKIKKLLENKKELLEELFTSSSYNNLRHLRQTTLDFARFYNYLPESSKTKEGLMEHIMSLFFSISFEIKKGNIIEEDINKR